MYAIRADLANILSPLINQLLVAVLFIIIMEKLFNIKKIRGDKSFEYTIKEDSRKVK